MTDEEFRDFAARAAMSAAATPMPIDPIMFSEEVQAYAALLGRGNGYSGGGGGSATWAQGMFALDYNSETKKFTIRASTAIYRVGGLILRYSGSLSVSAGINALVLKAVLSDDISGQSFGAEIQAYTTLSALASASADTSKYIIPLYEIEEVGEGEGQTVVNDFRIGPVAVMLEPTQWQGGD